MGEGKLLIGTFKMVEKMGGSKNLLFHLGNVGRVASVEDRMTKGKEQREKIHGNC